jgi:hypothetical protein
MQAFSVFKGFNKQSDNVINKNSAGVLLYRVHLSQQHDEMMR